MYETHFGLRERPFRATPDTTCYYPATSSERALARLCQALADDEGMVLLSGTPGTGKTLLCHCLLERLGSAVTTAFLTNSHVSSRAGLLQAILFDLSLPYEGRGEQELRLALTDFLLHNYSAGRRTVLVMDEAQHLSAELLEELRLLANLEARRAKAFQVVLAAQQSLLETLRQPELRGLAQRLAVRTCLEPLPYQEAADYLLHQLRISGGRPDAILSEEALEILARGSGGVPRLLNQAAHQALTLACAAGAPLVDAEAALEALDVLGLTLEMEAAEDERVESSAEATVEETSGLAEQTVLPLPDAAVAEIGETGEEEACRLFPGPRRSA